MIKIFTDGSCYNEIRVGGYAAYFEDLKVFHKNKIQNTTISRMEMSAIRLALQKILEIDWKDNDFIIFSDSEFVMKSMNWWLHNWVVDGSYKTRVNSDIWVDIHNLRKEIEDSGVRLRFYHIPSHQTDFDNPLVLGNTIADHYCNYKYEK